MRRIEDRETAMPTGEVPLAAVLLRPGLGVLGWGMLCALPLLWLWPLDPVHPGAGLWRLGLTGALSGAAWAALGRARQLRAVR